MTQKLHILLVDDMSFIQQITSTMLMKLGHSCEVADHGELALAALKKGRYDLVLMDVKMPVMDGLTATRHARALGLNLPIIGISGDTEEADKRACFDAGMNGFIKKPPSLESMQAEFKRVLGH
jgi:CheY-like chemotaxis protein